MASKATICLDDVEETDLATTREHAQSIGKLDSNKKDAKTISNRLYNTNTCNVQQRRAEKQKELKEKAKKLKESIHKDVKTNRNHKNLVGNLNSTTSIKIRERPTIPSISTLNSTMPEPKKLIQPTPKISTSTDVLVQASKLVQSLTSSNKQQK